MILSTVVKYQSLILKVEDYPDIVGWLLCNYPEKDWRIENTHNFHTARYCDIVID